MACLSSLQSEAASRALVHTGPVAAPETLPKDGTVYLIPVGEQDATASLEGIAASLRRKYGLDIRLLKPMEIDPGARSSASGKYVTQLLIDQIGRAHPELAARADATVIGVTDVPVINVSSASAESITARSGHFAIVSTHLLRDPWWRRVLLTKDATASRMQAVLTRTLLRDVAMLHWHLPLNFDATSVLFWGFDVDIPAEDVFASDLDPARSGSGEHFRDPCIVVTYSATKGMEHDFAAPVKECNRLDDNETDESLETFRLYLRNGLLEERHLELYQKGALPIRFGRTLARNWDSRNAFGRSGNDDYDRYLVTTDGMRTISITDVDHVVRMRRVPDWLQVMQWNHWVDQSSSGFEERMDWHGDTGRFLVARYDGEREWYLPCDDSTVCYLDSIEDGKGSRLQMERSGAQRELVRVSANDGRWVELKHDGASRIVEAKDNLGRRVEYAYSAAGQLESAQYSTGETLRYAYDRGGYLTSFGVAPPGGAAPTNPLMAVAYDPLRGYLTSLELADGTKCTFRYNLDSEGKIETVLMQFGEERYELAIGADGSSLREVSAGGR